MLIYVYQKVILTNNIGNKMKLLDIVIHGKPSEAQIMAADAQDALAAFNWVLKAYEGNAGVETLKLFNARFESRETEAVNIPNSLKALTENTNEKMIKCFFSLEWNGMPIQNDMIDSVTTAELTPLWHAVNDLNITAVECLLESGAVATAIVKENTYIDVLINKLGTIGVTGSYQLSVFPKIVKLLDQSGAVTTMSQEEVNEKISGYSDDPDIISSITDLLPHTDEVADDAAHGEGYGYGAGAGHDAELAYLKHGSLTPLQLAVSSLDSGAVEVLLGKGADPHKLLADGRNMMDILIDKMGSHSFASRAQMQAVQQIATLLHENGVRYAMSDEEANKKIDQHCDYHSIAEFMHNLFAADADAAAHGEGYGYGDGAEIVDLTGNVDYGTHDNNWDDA